MDDAEVMVISSILSIGAGIEGVCILVGDPLKWPTLLVSTEKRICSSFDDCAIPLYESVHKDKTATTFLRLCNGFPETFKVAHYQLHLRSWAYMRVF